MMNKIKQKIAWLAFRLDQKLSRLFKLKNVTFLYWLAVRLDVNNEIIPKSVYTDRLGV